MAHQREEEPLGTTSTLGSKLVGNYERSKDKKKDLPQKEKDKSKKISWETLGERTFLLSTKLREGVAM